jgi:hypothetical protein
MGMLDDAIREHLELKRLKGADPAGVAREERDALGPVHRGADLPEEDLPTDKEAAGVAELEVDADGPVSEAPEPGHEPPPHSGGQETVEINMKAELASRSEAGRGAAGEGGGTMPADRLTHTPSNSEESLEWEMPGDRADDTEIDAADDERAADETVEDVLEETPDFLRDTPEQERLWFEQRPPRDFDFNE